MPSSVFIPYPLLMIHMLFYDKLVSSDFFFLLELGYNVDILKNVFK